MTTNPRRKRQFQPQISSFFSHIPHDPTFSNTAVLRSPCPVLPDTVQSSLLNVGMRIRKAVPEGYQTEKADQMTVTHVQSDVHRRHLATIGNNSAGRAVELMPFCGLMKVGGYGVQDSEDESLDIMDGSNPESTNHSNLLNAYEVYTDNDFDLPLSQGSGISTISMDSAPAVLSTILPCRSRKRALDEDDNDEDGEEEFHKPLQHFLQTPNLPSPAPRQTLRSVRPRDTGKPRRRLVTPRRGFIPLPDIDFGEAEFLKFEVEEEDQECMELDDR